MIKSIIYDDMYKLSMGQAIFHQFPRVKARYKLIDRDIDRPYPKDMNEIMRDQINAMSDLHLDGVERDYLSNIRFIKPSYVEWLKGYRYNPSEVELYFDKPVVRNGYRELGTVEGPWYRTVWWEVKLLLLTSACYFNQFPKVDDWVDRIKQKAYDLVNSKCHWIDFGTRRSFNPDVHDTVVDLHSKHAPYFRGTSNMFLAMKYGFKIPIGTIAHEWFMAMQGKYGFRTANTMAMEHWIQEYDGDLGIALPDTLTTNVFLRSFTRKHAKLWDGVRLDSGDLFQEAIKFVEKYRSYDINPLSKQYIPSNSLTVKTAIEFRDKMAAAVGKDVMATAGIGTSIVNDVGYKPLNIVCKLDAIDWGDGWVNVIKKSDDPGKFSGDPRQNEIADEVLKDYQ